MKLRFPGFVLVLLLLVLLLDSCSVEKRHYRNGFYITWNHAVQQAQERNEIIRDTVPRPAVLNMEKERVCNDAARPVESDSVRGCIQKNAMVQQENPEAQPAVFIEPPGHAPDEPAPPGNDRVNPTVTGLVIAGMLLSLLFVFTYFVSMAGAAPYFFILAPLAGVLLFVAAMYLRQKYALRAASGEKSETLRLSAHYHRFRVMLYLFFIASLAMGIGYLFAFSVSGVASGVLGIVLGGGGVVLVQGVGIVLLVLGLIYLFRWRKDPTGYKPPRVKRPPKDG